MKAFIESQFNYCPWIWMLHSWTSNNKINLIHEGASRIVYSDYKSSFNELLDKDGSFTIHQKYFQSLATEIYKYLHAYLRIRNELYARNSKTVRYGTEIISFLSPKMWALIPQNVKDSSSLKRSLENGNPTAHVIYAKHFCNMSVLYSTTAASLLCF